jgi:4-amino-4-deoxy-L-arabinose transferase-like glycosyltransferase
MKQTTLHVVLLLAACWAVFFLNLGTPKLWDRDEPRNAGCAMEMMQRGDWVTPIFNAELREQKPVLLYWLMMSAYTVFGYGEFGARFWSAALATGTCLWVFAIARRLYGSQVAIWSSLLLATSLMFDVAGRAATPDSVLVFCGASAIGCWVLGTFRPNESNEVRTWSQPGLKADGVWFPQDWRLASVIYFFMGLGVLAKGPIGFVMPVAILGTFNLLGRLPEQDASAEPQGAIARRLVRLTRPWRPFHFLKTTLSMRPGLAVLVVLAVASPWYIWVGLRTDGDFLTQFFLKEHFGRATTAMENHSGGIWFYPAALLMGTFPWSILALPMGLFVDRQLSQRREDRPVGLVLGLIWLSLYLIVFSLAKTKLPSYITPCYPGVALMGGLFVSRLSSAATAMDRRWWFASLGVLSLVGLLIAVGVPVAATKVLPGAGWLGLIGLIPLLGAFVLGFLVFRRLDRWVPVTFSLMAVLFSVSLFGVGTVAVDRYQRSTELLGVVRQDPEARVASFGVLESSWVFYSGHPIYELNRQGRDGKTQRDLGKDWKPKPRMSVEQFLSQGGNHYLVTTDTQLPDLQKQAGGVLSEVARVPYFLNDEDLVLLTTQHEFMARKDQLTETPLR